MFHCQILLPQPTALNLQVSYSKVRTFRYAPSTQGCVFNCLEVLDDGPLPKAGIHRRPLTIDDLEIRDQSLEEFLRNCGVQRPLGWPTQFVPEPAAAIALAEDFDIKTILPAVYYDLMRCLTDKGWDEALEADLQFFATNTRMGKPARWDCLSAKSFRKLLRLRDFAEYQSRWELEGVGDHDPVTVEPACMMDGGCSRWTAGVRDSRRRSSKKFVPSQTVSWMGTSSSIFGAFA